MTAAAPSPPSSLLSLAGRAGHRFVPHVMVQGFACYVRGVEIVSASDHHVHARVRSKRIHEVDLKAERGTLLVACTCPKQSLDLAVCKHAWAALLEVDRSASLAGLRTDRGTITVVGVDRAPPSMPNGPEAAPQRSEAKATLEGKKAKPRSDRSPEAEPKTKVATSTPATAARAAPTRAARTAAGHEKPDAKPKAQTKTKTKAKPTASSETPRTRSRRADPGREARPNRKARRTR